LKLRKADNITRWQCIKSYLNININLYLAACRNNADIKSCYIIVLQKWEICVNASEFVRRTYISAIKTRGWASKAILSF